MPLIDVELHREQDLLQHLWDSYRLAQPASTADHITYFSQDGWSVISYIEHSDKWDVLFLGRTIEEAQQQILATRQYLLFDSAG